MAQVHRAGLDQQAVIRAAAQLADTQGIEAVTLATLAAHLKVRPPTLYHYVNGLEGLRHDLALSGNRELATTLGRAIMGKSGDDALSALAIAYRGYAREHPGLYSVVQRAASPEDIALAEAEGEVVDIVLRVLTAYRLTGDDAIHTVRLLRSMLHGFVSLEITNGFGLPLDVDETFHRLIGAMIQSVKSLT